MPYVTLGSTGITVPKNGFGALPIQRVTADYAVMLLRKAYDAGVRFFDTANGYTDSEEKIGKAFHEIRENIYIATKTGARDAETFRKHLNLSLERMQTDYIDIYQFHNLPFCPKPGDGTGLYEAMLEAKEKGLVRHIGITNHRLAVAKEAIESGLYETLQFPFSYLASDKDLELVQMCKDHNMGFIAMKGLSGGLLNKSDLCYAWMLQFDNVLPIWGVQRESELDEFLSYTDDPPALNEERLAAIEKDREELSGNFCRSCGYCMPCTVGIQIPTAARMIQLIRRMPSAAQLTPEMQKEMEKIEDCVECGACMSRCPYELPIPKLLRENLEDYRRIVKGEIDILNYN